MYYANVSPNIFFGSMEGTVNSDIVVSKKREIWIDVLRGTGALLVLLAHSKPPMMKVIFGFTIPLFFMITGYLWKPNHIRINLKRFILPYFILCAINLLLETGMLLLKNEEIPIKNFVIGIFYSRGEEEWMPNCATLWYLTGIFCALVIFGLIQKLKSEPLKIILIIAAGTVSGLLSFFEVFKLPWNLDSALMGVGFIYVGYMIKRLDVLEKMRKTSIAWQVLLLLLLGTAGMFSIYFNPDRASFNNNRYGNVFLMIGGAITICFVVFYLCYRIPWKGWIAKYLSWLGKHTIFIMGFDLFCRSVARGILEKIGFNNWASVFIFRVVVLSAGCLVWTWCVNKIRNESIRKALSY